VARYALRLSIAGGEPFLHARLFDLIEEASRRGLYTIAHTNGTLLTKRLDDLRRSSLDSLNVSLYDHILEQTLEIAGHAARQLEASRSPMRLGVARVVTKESMDAVIPLLEKIQRHGIRRVYLQNYYTRDQAQAANILQDSPSYRAWARQVKGYARQHDMAVVIPGPWRKESQVCDFCYSLLTTVAYDANGQISPCCFIAPPDGGFGNVFGEDPLNNPHYLALRRAVTSGKGRAHPACRHCYLLGARWHKFF